MQSNGNLIVFLNRWCPVGCASCNAGVKPTPGAILSPQWLSRFFQSPLVQHSRPKGSGGYIVWTGGEPFLTFDSLKTGIELAQQRNYKSEILTSGIWFEKHPHHLATLSDFGSFSLRISTDAEHQKHVPPDVLVSLIKTARQLGIEVNLTLRRIPGHPDTGTSLPELLKVQLPEYYEENNKRSRWIHYIPHMPIKPSSNAKHPTVKKHHLGKKCIQACNQGFKDIVIGADGLIYPCCGLFGTANHHRLAFGDALTVTGNQIDDIITQSALFSLLKEQGPYAVCRELGLEPETWQWDPFKIPCQLCIALFQLHGQRVLKLHTGDE